MPTTRATQRGIKPSSSGVVLVSLLDDVPQAL
jgi:hypothetical protein